MWYSRIPDLSDNFIACDDDYFFLNSVPEDLLFENNVPMSRRKTVKYSVVEVNQECGNWKHLISNASKFVAEQTGNFTTMFAYSHLPEPRSKKFEADFLKKHYDFVHDATKPSHFRYRTNLNSSLYIDLMKATNYSHSKEVYKNSKFFSLRDLDDKLFGFFMFPKKRDGEEVDKVYDIIVKSSYQMICLNDSDIIPKESYLKIKFKLHRAFREKFPDKCDFEL